MYSTNLRFEFYIGDLGIIGVLLNRQDSDIISQQL